MLRHLLCLCALIALTGAQTYTDQTVTESSMVDISSCPITYYGQQYKQLYVNITSGNLTVCFNGFFSPETGGDCIVERSLGTESFYFDTYSDPYNDNCYFDIYFNNFALVHYMHDTQPQLYSNIYNSDPLVFELQVGGTTVDTVTATSYYYYYFYYHSYSFSISGCRHSGQMYRPGTVTNSPETCFSLTCDETAHLHTSSCGPQERCQGNNICMLASTCTVTGPTVIDIHGHMNSIQDRCAYSLFSTPTLPDFLVLGNFRDRSRKDVSFLDSVTLHLDGHYIHLEQGGRVQLDDSTLTLDSSLQLVHGVQLSKDQTGVTAKLSLSNLTISVFFDGDTAQIHLERPAGSSVEGLCGNSSRSLSDLRLSEYSSTSCEMQYSETADGTIDCNSVTERCNLLKEAPFSSCNSDIDPEPYITACTDILCKYSAVDGLNCQFLKAYARACSLHNHTLDGWTSKTGCCRTVCA